MHWHSVRVFYYRPDKSDLLLRGVRPLFDRLRPEVEAVSFIRHWRQGPHVRLNFLTDETTFTETIWPTVRRDMRAYLAEAPSTTVLDIDQELRRHARMAELEHERGPLTPWHSDNSVVLSEFDPRTDIMGDTGLADALARFYSDTTDLAFDCYDACRTRSALLSRALDLMIAAGHIGAAGGIRQGFVSFRSHAEGFLAANDDGAALRGRWDANFRHSSDRLRDRVTALVDAIDHARFTEPFLADWVRIMGRWRTFAEATAAAGVSPVPPPPPPAPGAARRLGEASAFHHRLFGNPTWATMQQSAEFAVYRLILNFTYLHLTQLGVTPVERVLLCHLAAEAVEAAYGISAYEIIGQPYIGRAVG